MGEGRGGLQTKALFTPGVGVGGVTSREAGYHRGRPEPALDLQFLPVNYFRGIL